MVIASPCYAAVDGAASEASSKGARRCRERICCGESVAVRRDSALAMKAKVSPAIRIERSSSRGKSPYAGRVTASVSLSGTWMSLGW